MTAIGKDAGGWTPGPWLIHAERRWIVPAGDAFKAPADALPICQLRDPDERLTEDETLENGFLIAAAPELYEVLKSICAAFPDDAPALIEARRVLAKARGKSAQ